MATRNTADLYASIALFLSGPAFALLSTLTNGTAPLQILSFALILFGLFSYGATAGLEKPLNRLLMVALLFCAYGFLEMTLEGDPQGRANAAVLYLLSLFLGIMIWAAALLHRPGKAKQLGAVGLMFGFGPLALLVAGHVVLGFGGAIGVQAIWEAQANGNIADPSFLKVANLTLGLWAIACGIILFVGLLRRT